MLEARSRSLEVVPQKWYGDMNPSEEPIVPFHHARSAYHIPTDFLKIHIPFECNAVLCGIRCAYWVLLLLLDAMKSIVVLVMLWSSGFFYYFLQRISVRLIRALCEWGNAMSILCLLHTLWRISWETFERNISQLKCFNWNRFMFTLFDGDHITSSVSQLQNRCSKSVFAILPSPRIQGKLHEFISR